MKRQGGFNLSYAGPFNRSANVSSLIQLAASDYVEVYANSSSNALGVGATQTWFNGFLVSQT